MKRIGILGGSFDPCHRGHVNLALDALKQAELDEVIFMPAKVQPFKMDKKTADAVHRMNMLNLALEGYEGLRASAWEIENSQVSYTYRTLEEIRKMKGPDTEVFFITGTDAFLTMRTWANGERLLSENRFIVGIRPGYREKELEDEISAVRADFGTEVIKIDNRRFHISSTEIRDRLKKGESIADLVDNGVERYILENGLYI